MAGSFYLSEEDVNLLRLILEDQSKEAIYSGGSGLDEWIPPDINLLVVRTPINGIPPMVTSGGVGVPDPTSCEVYFPTYNQANSRLELVKLVGMTVPVLNLSSSWITEDYILVMREKYGSWVCGGCSSDSATGTGTGTGS